MAIFEIAVAGVGFFLAGVIKGATGLGYASCALPFLVISFGLKPAMCIVILPALATNIQLAFAAGHFRETIAKFRWLYLTMLPGIVVGIYFLNIMNQSLSVQIFGFVIVTYALLALGKPQFRMPSYLEAPLQWPTGFLNGVVTGLTGAQVMPLFPYVMSLQLDSDRTVQVVNLSVMIATTALAVGLISTGVLTPELFFVSLIALVPALIGTEIGNRVRSKIPAQNFRRLALLTLLLLGTLMLMR